MARHAGEIEQKRVAQYAYKLAEPVEEGDTYRLAPDDGTGAEIVLDASRIVTVTDDEILFVTVRDPEDKNALPRLDSVRVLKLPDSFTQRWSSRWLEVDPATGRPKEHLRVIVSTLSGLGQSPQFYKETVQPLLERLNIDFETHFTESPRSVAEITERDILPRALKGEKQSILLLSGDGGIVDMVNVLRGAIDRDKEHGTASQYVNPSIFLIPMGTGNALANSSGILDDDTVGLSTFLRGGPRPLPLLRVTFSPDARLLTHEATVEEPLPRDPTTDRPVLYGAVVCSWGVHASLVADSDSAAYRRFGAERFGMAAREALFPADGGPPHTYRGTVRVRRGSDGAWTPLGTTEHMYVLATLVSTLERGFRISPASRAMDGRVRLVHFGPVGGAECMRILNAAYQEGAHVEEEAVRYEEVEGVRVEFQGLEAEGRWRRVCVDGKIVRLGAEGYYELVPEPEVCIDVACLDAKG